MIKDVDLGKDVNIFHRDLVNLYGCTIGQNSFIGPFVEIQAGAKIGKRCKIQSHTFICEGVEIQDDVFIGHGVMFVNDNYPNISHSTSNKGDQWQLQKIIIKKGASVGSNATILGGVTIGEKAIVGAGAVVTKNVNANKIVKGVPAK